MADSSGDMRDVDSQRSARDNQSSNGLNVIRDRIDALDAELVRLLAARIALVTSASEFKPHRSAVADPARADRVLAGVRARAAECGAAPAVVDAIYRVIIDEGIKLEQDAYDGRPQGPVPQAVSANSSAPAHDLGDRVASAHLMNVMATMRAMRRLDHRPVPAKLLTDLVEAASWAPVGGNLHNRYRFVVVTDRSRMERLAPYWSRAMRFYLNTLAPPRSPSEEERFRRVRAAMDYQSRHFARLPALIVVCLEPANFWKRLLHAGQDGLRELMALPLRDRLRVLANLRRWADRASSASVYPATQNLLLAARAHGLGATLTTWHSAFEQDFKTVLDIPRAVDIYAIVPVGYPLGNFGAVRRPPVEQLLDHDHWRGSDGSGPRVASA